MCESEHVKVLGTHKIKVFNAYALYTIKKKVSDVNNILKINKFHIKF